MNFTVQQQNVKLAKAHLRLCRADWRLSGCRRLGFKSLIPTEALTEVAKSFRHPGSRILPGSRQWSQTGAVSPRPRSEVSISCLSSPQRPSTSSHAQVCREPHALALSLCPHTGKAASPRRPGRDLPLGRTWLWCWHVLSAGGRI